MQVILWFAVIIFYEAFEATCNREVSSPVQPISWLKQWRRDAKYNQTRNDALDKAKNCGHKLFGEEAVDAARKKSIRVESGAQLAGLLIDRDHLSIPLEIIHVRCKESCRRQLLLEPVSRCEYSSTHEACIHGCDDVVKWVRRGDKSNVEDKAWGECDCKKEHNKLICLDRIVYSSSSITPAISLILALLVAV
eukprot:Platyproteum_vivax@DN4762_c0_g1_i1.p1